MSLLTMITTSENATQKLKADYAVVSLQADPPESLHHSKLYLCVAPSPGRVLSEQDSSAII